MAAPWLRIERLILAIRETRRDAKTWPTVKATLKQALEWRKKIRRAEWFSRFTTARNAVAPCGSR